MPITNDDLRQEAESHVVKIIADYSGLAEAQITPQSRLLDDLGLDSLDRVEIVMDIEEEFGIEISLNEEEQLNSVGQLQRIVIEKSSDN